MERAEGPENPNESNGRAVKPCESGEGLPYAPINWPNPGDNWRWRVGKRVSTLGYYLDRYLFPPKRLYSLTGLRKPLDSVPAVKRFVQENFPGADTEAFFNSFSWKIPANNHSSFNGDAEGSNLPSEKTSDDSVPNSASNGVKIPANNQSSLNGDAEGSNRPSEKKSQHSVLNSSSDGASCKIGNKTCISLFKQAEDDNPKPMPCDICCTEPRFCVYCCCILCGKKIKTDYDGYSYIKCEATADGGYICGHVAHLNCGLRTYLAGTLGGNTGLDAEYYCRRCDSKKDLITHVLKLLETCESIKSRKDIERILNVGVFILRGSKKTSAKRLLNRVKFSIIKLKCGTPLDDIWDVEEGEVAKFMDGADDTSEAPEPAKSKYPPAESNLLPELTETADYRNKYQRIDDEMDRILQNLKRSQETEYKIAEDRFNGHKKNLNNLLNQLDNERAGLALRPDANTDTLLKDRTEQVKREIESLWEMEKIRNGFGKTPKGILNQHFGMNVDD